MQRVELVLVLGLLREDAARAGQQIVDLGLRLLGQRGELARHFALHATHARAQRASSFTHALKLLGMGIAADLRGQPRGRAVVVLAQGNAMFLSHLHQVLATLLQQAAVRGVRSRLGHEGGVDDDRSTLDAFTTPSRRAASMVAISKVSTPSSPMRFLQRVRLLGSKRASICRYASPQVLPIRVLDPSVDHGVVGSIDGVLQVHQRGERARRQCGSAAAGTGVGEKVRSISAQSISPARRTSGWRMLISSSSRETNRSSVSAAAGLGPIGQTSSEFARKLRSKTIYPASRVRGMPQNLKQRQWVTACSGRTNYSPLISGGSNQCSAGACGLIWLLRPFAPEKLVKSTD